MRTYLFLLATLLECTNAWRGMMGVSTPTKSRSNERKSEKGVQASLARDAATLGAAASIAFATFVGGVGGPSYANAAEVDFTGAYSDPKHPNCVRLVAVEGTEALLTGADGNPGCPTGEGRPWKLVGKITEGGDKILVDFSPKGGPKDLLGTWEAGKKPGIKWPDGNKWTLTGRPE